MNGEPGDCFARDYRAARRHFLDAADQAGARVEEYVIDPPGPAGEPLSVDVARIGDGGEARLVIVSSGLHGVEGFLGSAAQVALLRRHAGGGGLPAGSGLLLVHALNPYGFAWRRRWNENNVDLNRNFLVRPDELLADPGYAGARETYCRAHDFLNPKSPPPVVDDYLVQAVRLLLHEGARARRRLPPEVRPLSLDPGALLRLGVAEMRRTLPVGQYEYPHGLFYGGRVVQPETALVQAEAARWAGAARSIVQVDVHTGLGPYGQCSVLLNDAPGSPRVAWAQARFAPEVVQAEGGHVAYVAHGSMTQWLQEHLADRDCICLTAEVGTYGPVRVLGALRAENRAHFHTRRGSRAWERAKRELVSVFCPAHTAWRRRALAAVLDVVARAAA